MRARLALQRITERNHLLHVIFSNANVALISQHTYATTPPTHRRVDYRNHISYYRKMPSTTLPWKGTRR
jgi:hypothetical protein